MLSLNQDCILTDSEPVFLKYKNVNIFPLVLVWNCELNVGGGKLTWTYSPFCSSVVARGPEAAEATCCDNNYID